MRIFWGGVIVGTIFGLLVGVMIGQSTSRSTVVPSPAPESPPSISPAPRDGEAELGASPSAGPEGDQDAQAALARANKLLGDVQAQLTAANAQTRTAESEARTLKEKAEAEAARIPFPEDLPERFLQEPLRGALDEAVREFGGEVTSVDCSEYPCLFQVEVPFADLPEHFSLGQHLRNHPAMKAYESDGSMLSITSRTNDEGEALAHSSHAFLPLGTGPRSPDEDHMGERTSQRMKAWMNALNPPPSEPTDE